MEITIAYQRLLEQHGYKYLALYYALREAILSGTLPCGSKLPSTRKLAELYDISRGSAAEAYDLLLTEGYVQSAVGRGTYVTQELAGLPQSRLNSSTIKLEQNRASSPAVSTQSSDAVSDRNKKNIPPAAAVQRLSRWGQRILELEPSSKNISNKATCTSSPLCKPKIPMEERISFEPQDIILSGSSFAAWQSALRAAGRDMQAADFANQTDIGGDQWLREAICVHVGRTRGIQASPEQVVLCSGSMEAIVLLCQLLINEQDSVVLEDPCYTGITRAILASGGQIVPAPVDHSGLMPQAWKARLLFVTPSRQFPTGVVLPLSRRQQLLQWANQQGSWIIEDDYDSEFRWGGRPIEPLKALDRTDSVIYVSSFSKSMFSGLRIGYAIMPPDLAKALIAAKRIYDPLPSSQLEQRALARFMMRGEYMRHLRRMTRTYRQRHHLLREQLCSQLDGLFEWMPADSGLHLYGIWQYSAELYKQFRILAAQHGVCWRDAAEYQLTDRSPAGYFSFAGLDEEQIHEGINRLQQAWKQISVSLKI